MYLNSLAFRQKGFLMPVAIFILLVMGGLAFTISRYTGQMSNATVQEIISVEAFYAAESGAQYAMNQIFYDTAQVMTAAIAETNCNNLTSPGAFTGTGLQGCTATLSCSSNLTSGVRFFTITSVGQCGAATSFRSSRTIEVSSFIE